MTTEVVKELTVTQYEFYKSGGMTDAKVMKIHGLDHNQLYKWKKENDLVGKDYGLRGGPSVKTYKASEVKPLKENDIPAERLKDSYSPNKKLQEKLAEKKPEAKGWERVKELTESMSQEKKSEVLATVAGSEKTSSIKETPQPKEHVIETVLPKSVQDELEMLYKEKAYLEEQHVKDTAEKDELLESLKKYQDIERYQELMQKVSNAVTAERNRQNKLYGHQRHESGKWLAILAEEFGEVAQAMQRGEGWGKESDADDLFKELTHVSAVANAWAEQVLEEAESDGR